MSQVKRGRGRGGSSMLKVKLPGRKGFSPITASEAPSMKTDGTPGKGQKATHSTALDLSLPSGKTSDVRNGTIDLDVDPKRSASKQKRKPSYVEDDSQSVSNSLPDEAQEEGDVPYHKSNEMYECDLCDFSTPYYSGILTHGLIHEGESPYICKVCGFTTPRRGLMVIHMRMHKGFKPYKCSMCDYSTLQEMHLKVHLRTHSQEKPFKCQGCSYRCSTQEILNEHMNKHEHNTRIFKCDVCDYTTMRKHNLIQHTTIHTGAKPFKCDLCPYSSSQKGHLNVHIRTHTREKPFKCTYCPFASTVPKSLREHLQMHIGKRPLQCPYCSFSSSQAFSIKRHIALHEEVQKFTCDLCSFSTTIEEDFMTHRTIHSQNTNYHCPQCTYETPFKHVYLEHLKLHKDGKVRKPIEGEKNHPKKATLDIEFEEFEERRSAVQNGTSEVRDELHYEPENRPLTTLEALGLKRKVPLEIEEKAPEEIIPEPPKRRRASLENGMKKKHRHHHRNKDPSKVHKKVSRKHIKSSFKCQYCDRSFVGQELWKRHTARHFMEWPEIE